MIGEQEMRVDKDGEKQAIYLLIYSLQPYIGPSK